MSGFALVACILVAVVLVFGALWFLIPFLVKRGVDFGGIFSVANTALDVADMVVDKIKDIVPGIDGLVIIDSIIDYAKKGVEAAEQLYLASKIEANTRKAAARQIVYDCLRLGGIELTDEIRTVTDAMIEAAVLALPKTHMDGETDDAAKE